MKCFNTTGSCKPERHYMVDIQKRLEEIRVLIDASEYFVMNRARQYGTTTTLVALIIWIGTNRRHFIQLS